MTSDPIPFPPDSPGIIEASGKDAARFLNGQVTQEVRFLGDRTLFSCITDAKGKLQHFVELTQGPEAGCIWVLCRSDEVDEVFARLDRYLIADEVELRVRTGEWHRHRQPSSEDTTGFSRVAAWPEGWVDHWDRGGVESRNIWPDELEERRISEELPRWGKEIVPGMLPPEAGLDRIAISYQKGCYIGQETLSRIKSAGKLNRKLVGLRIAGPVSEGDSLEIDGVACGEITSISPSGQKALGFVKKSGFGVSEFTIGPTGSHAELI